VPVPGCFVSIKEMPTASILAGARWPLPWIFPGRRYTTATGRRVSTSMMELVPTSAANWRRSTASIGGFGQIKSQRLTNEAGQPTTMQNTGFTTALQFDDRAAQLAPSAGTHWSDPEMPRQFETRSGAVARFNWRVS
jgi:hypothetical protein